MVMTTCQGSVKRRLKGIRKGMSSYATDLVQVHILQGSVPFAGGSDMLVAAAVGA